MKPSRVLLTTDAVGGVWRYTIDLAAGLARQGIQVLIACLGPRPSAEKKVQLSRMRHVELREGEFALEWMPDSWRDVDAAGDWLLQLESEFSPGLIHLNGYAHAALPWSNPVLSMAHSCVCSWWRAVHACAPGPEWDEYRRRVARGLRAANAVAAPSAWMATAIERDYGLPVARVRVIHNFSRARVVDTEPKQPFFLAAARAWDAAKNFQLLDGIASRLSWKLRIASTLAHADLQREMTRAAIFVHPALYEPFGLSVLEAAGHRCALVLADIPSLRELWDHAAVFIDPRDEDRWASELNRLAGDQAAQENLARLAHRRAAQYSAATAMRQYMSLYSALLSSRGAGFSRGDLWAGASAPPLNESQGAAA